MITNSDHGVAAEQHDEVQGEGQQEECVTSLGVLSEISVTLLDGQREQEANQPENERVN